MIQAVMTAWGAELRETRGRSPRLICRALITCLHILQPMVRLKGRVTGGLMIWQRTRWRWWDWPIVVNRTLWSEQWESPEQRLEKLEAAMRSMGASCFRGQPTDRWDIEIRGGFFGHFRLRMMVEEHGGGKQLTRLRGRPVMGAQIPLILALLVLSVVGALVMESPGLVLLFVMLTVTVTALTLGECGVATAYFKTAVARALGKNL